jgi:hypothetical protein
MKPATSVWWRCSSIRRRSAGASPSKADEAEKNGITVGLQSCSLTVGAGAGPSIRRASRKKKSDAGTGSVSLKFKQQFAGHRDMTIITTGQSK